MLAKVILKNYRSNIKKYIAFFICNIVTIGMLFMFWGLFDTFTGPSLGILMTDIQGDYVIICLAFAIITILMLFYSLKNHMKQRARDYSMMLVLGMRKKQFLLLITAEYLLSWVISLMAGLLLGKAFSYGMTAFFRWTFLPDLEYIAASSQVYKRTLLLALGLFVAVYFALMVWLEESNPMDLAKTAERRERRPRSLKWLLVTLAGVLMCVFACRQYLAGWWFWILSHLWWVVSAALILVSLTGVILGRIQKTGFYYRHLVRLNTLYSRYMNHFAILLILFSIHFFVLGYVGNLAASRFPLETDRSLYPYDYIWMAKEKDESFAGELAKDYQGEKRFFPAVRVVGEEEEERIGISASSYQELTGEAVQIEDRQVLLSIPNRKAGERKVMENSADEVFLYPGKYTEEQVKRVENDAMSFEPREEYMFQVYQTVSENVLGDYTQSVITNSWVYGMTQESLVVFPDELFEVYHQEMKENPEEPSELILFRFPEELRKIAGEKLKDYDEREGIADLLQLDLVTYPQKNLYDTEEIIENVEHNNQFFLLFGLVTGLDLFFCSFLLYAVKLLSDFEIFRRKYEVLNSLGMRWKEQKKTIRSEILCDTWISLLAAFAMSVTYTWCCVKAADQGGRELWSGYLVVWFIMALGYCVLNWLISEGIVRYMEYKIRKVRK